MKLHTDIETYSSVNLSESGVYRYVESPDFEILMIAFAFGSRPVKIIDLKQGERVPDYLISAFLNPEITKLAFNATFERLCLRASGIDIPIDQWECTMIKAAYCGLPLKLSEVSKVLNGTENVKDSAGKALIRYFAVPCKPTKTNGGRTRNLPKHDPDKWQAFKNYCVQDVNAERAVDTKLQNYNLPEIERSYYAIDQRINDIGVCIDLKFAKKATNLDSEYVTLCKDRLAELTGLSNPNSVAQLKAWLSSEMSENVESLTKDDVTQLLNVTDNPTVREALTLRQKISKASIRKYNSILNCICRDGRGHGFFQFYGARTGRWAGRLVQLHNLVRNKLSNLETVKNSIKNYDLDTIGILHGDLSYLLSQLVRTNFVPAKNKTFVIADFSAIEARVAAWLAQERWRLEVFETHGRIYEASAANMFNVPMNSIGKGSELRQKGKIAELALGYGGSTGALTVMGADAMGLTTQEMKDIVSRWRKASPNIVKLWKQLENAAKLAIKAPGARFKAGRIAFISDNIFLQMVLPSGRRLFYYDPKIVSKTVNRPNSESFQTESITYMGVDQEKRKWARLDTYGGKLLENASQAVSRDLLAYSMLAIQDKVLNTNIVMHVHDENVCEVPLGEAEESLKIICQLMERSPPWAEDLKLVVDGYISPFYRKD